MTRTTNLNDKLINAYFDDMEVFVDMCSDMTLKVIERDIDRGRGKNLYLGDVDEIVQQICYLMLKRELTRDNFVEHRMSSYVGILIRSCIARIWVGREKHGDGYILR